MPLQHWMQLALAEGLGPVLLKRLLDAAGSAEAACCASVSLLRNIEGIGSAKAEQIARGLKSAASEAADQLEQAQRLGVGIIHLQDPCYPALLLSIHDPPPILYLKGDLQPRDLNAIAIVGSRGCSLYGREQAHRFGASLAGIGFTIVSGGARGVDSAAHQGALSHPAGRTIAILGCGVDRIYPPENAPLFEQIAQQGAILSEFPLGTEPRPEHFPRRNRIVSGMARGVLVIEADIKSGALITAHSACEQDRPVFALPGRVDNKMSAGPHKLIREGATLATSVQDIVEGLTPLPAEIQAPSILVTDPAAGENSESDLRDPQTQISNLKSQISNPKSPLPNVPITPQQSQILASISDAPTGVDAMVEFTGLPAHIVLQELTMLSLKCLIKRVDGQTYIRR